ncbi:MAG: urea ABC transporter permease subunit UrtB [Myxococcales bacterium]|nr:urea ABC transporter permease subunit UrtB [Myxococcales bacterium]
MKRIRRVWFAVAATLLVAAPAAPAASDDFESAFRGLGSSSRNTLLESIEKLAELDDGRALGALEALFDKRLRADDTGRLFIESKAGDSFVDALSGQPADPDPEALRAPRINNRVRRALKPVIAQLRLRSPDPDVRLAAAETLRRQPSESAAVLIRTVLEDESDAGVRDALVVALAQTDLAGEDPELRLAAVETLGRLGDRNFKAQLEALLETSADGSPLEADEEVRAAAKLALARIDRVAFFVDIAGNFFYGLSLASILLLAALGLAITFGLMGVINMAHGEMLMVGAYTTYVMLGLFETHLPGLLDGYILAAIPAAFVVCGCIGMGLERGVIRFLYGRPLETLLATWGISLVLIQTVRLVFGAHNVEVANPTWLSGGYEIFRGVVLPWSRIYIVLFAGLTVTGVWLVLQRTPLGLNVRAVTQNREMAANLGIATSRVDMWTFGLGSGIAGLGGVALSQIGNVGPELGQSYIVDSFMVVVLGGVGKLAGTVTAALGLGIVNKFLEPVSGAVLGKIFVLGFLILFIQRRPQGIFALKGRAAET